MGSIRRWTDAWIAKAALDHSRYGLLVIGDLNSAIRDATSFHMASGTMDVMTSSSLRHPQRWAAILEDLVEMDCPDFTHYDAKTEQLNTLTRCWITAPTWILSFLWGTKCCLL
eukprot:TRINITY_DN21112_c0_g1_i1.p2 TRINITY_DN21112_c0_g1~~TRINITY_DN21112_c0_g1_i1.p2  ORF type:complete len:113 (-),score=11.83 TRINITY_DN21112_c0_g1_i1:476-814(-)